MVRLIGNVLVFGLTAILLSSCAAGVKVIDTYTIEKKREPLALADPKPLDLQDIDWIIITKDNADEVFEKVQFGKIKIKISKKYKLVDAKQAHTDLESRKLTGPAILIP